MSTEARTTLDAKLTVIELAVRDAQEYEHENGLANIRTRKLPAELLRVLHRWRSQNSGVMNERREHRSPARPAHR